MGILTSGVSSVPDIKVAAVPEGAMANATFLSAHISIKSEFPPRHVYEDHFVKTYLERGLYQWRLLCGRSF